MERWQVLLIITDGMENELSGYATCSSSGGNGCARPIDVARCKQLKTNKALIAILHPPYVPMSNDPSYKVRVKPVESLITPALMDCASPGLYKAVSPGSDLGEGLNDLFGRAVNMPRLTM